MSNTSLSAVFFLTYNDKDSHSDNIECKHHSSTADNKNIDFPFKQALFVLRHDNADMRSDMVLLSEDLCCNVILCEVSMPCDTVYNTT